MADTVRALMEAMVPELEDYARRGYFERAEIDAIVKRREHFEYQLRRRNAIKSDFLRYYEYEWKLEQLRRLRRKDRSIRGARSLADYGIVRRIHFIFDRATRKFKGDLAIWTAWLQFCKQSDSTLQVSKVVTKALKLHPGAPFLWAFAASWEFESNGNPGVARQLLQTGIRSCSSDPSLWVEFYRMELLYANKLAARRRALGLVPDKEAATTPSGADASAAPTGTASGGFADAAGAPDSDDADIELLHGALASLVAREAVKALPKDIGLRQRLLRVTHQVPCLGTQALKQQLTDGMLLDFAESSEGCAVIADCIEQGLIEHGGSDGGTGMLAAGTFLVERALAARRADVQGAALAFLSARLADMDAECVARAARGSRRRRSDAAVPAAQASAVALLGLLDRAAAVACDGDCWQAVASRAEVLVLSGQRAPAIAALDRALEGSLGGHWELWEVRLELASKAAEAAGAAGSRRARQGGAAADAVRRLVAVALERVSAIGRWKLFPQCLSLLFASGDDGSAVFAAVQAALRTPAPASAQAGSVTAEILRAVRTHLGPQRAEALGQELDALPSPGVEYWRYRVHDALDACQHEATASRASVAAPGRDVAPGLRTCCQRCEVAFHKATLGHGADDVQLWLDWVAYRRRIGNDSGAIVARGLATLRDRLADEFSAALQSAA